MHRPDSRLRAKQPRFACWVLKINFVERHPRQAKHLMFNALA